MLFKCKMLRAQRKMLRQPFQSMDAVGQSETVERGGIIAVQTVRWDKNLHLVIFFSEFGRDLQVSGIAERVGVFGAEMGQFLSMNALDGLRQKEELMTEPRGKSCGLEIARVEEKLHGVSLVKPRIERLFKGFVDENINEQARFIPGDGNVGKALFNEPFGGLRQQIAAAHQLRRRRRFAIAKFPLHRKEVQGGKRGKSF